MINIFSLIDNGKSMQLAMNGAVVSFKELKLGGYPLEKNGKGDSCPICAPKWSGALRVWYKVQIICNGINGEVLICSSCSAVHECKDGYNEKRLWSELVKSIKIGFYEDVNNLSVGISFDKFLQLDKPYNYITYDDWTNWCQTLQAHPFSKFRLLDIANFLGLQWPQINHKEISEYCNIRLEDIMNLELGMRRTLFLVIAYICLNISTTNNNFENIIQENELSDITNSVNLEQNLTFTKLTEVVISPVIEQVTGLSENIITSGDLIIDISNHRVWRGSDEINVSERMYNLLLYMVHNPNLFLSYKMINTHAFESSSAITSKCIDNYVKYLKECVDKLWANKLIHLIPGKGCIFVDDTGEYIVYKSTISDLATRQYFNYIATSDSSIVTKTPDECSNSSDSTDQYTQPFNSNHNNKCSLCGLSWNDPKCTCYDDIKI